MDAYMVMNGKIERGIPHGYAYGIDRTYRATYLGTRPIIWIDDAVSANGYILSVPGDGVIVMITNVRQNTPDRYVYTYESDGWGLWNMIVKLGECEEIRWQGSDGQWYLLTVKDGVPLVSPQ